MGDGSASSGGQWRRRARIRRSLAVRAAASPTMSNSQGAKRLPPMTPTSAAAPAPTNTRAQWSLALAFLLAAGVAATRHLGRPLWIDEAWVGNSVLEPTWRQMIFYPDWAQTTPLSFLALMRISVKLLGASELALRLPGALCGAALGALALLLGLRLFRPAVALLCAAFPFLAPTVIPYCDQVKQYGCDVAVGYLLTFLGWRYWERPTRGRFVALCAITTACLTLSYTAVFFAGALVLVCGFAGAQLPSAMRAARAATFAVVATLVFAGVYWLVILSNNTPELTWCWRNAYPQRGGGYYSRWCGIPARSCKCSATEMFRSFGAGSRVPHSPSR